LSDEFSFDSSGGSDGLSDSDLTRAEDKTGFPFRLGEGCEAGEFDIFGAADFEVVLESPPTTSDFAHM
jgi:hypothetical protein